LDNMKKLLKVIWKQLNLIKKKLIITLI